MRWIYVCYRPVEGTEEQERPPDEVFVIAAARELGIEVTTSHYKDPELLARVENIQPHIVLFSHPIDGFPDPMKNETHAMRMVSPDSVFALLSFDLTSYEGDPGREDRYSKILRYLDAFCTKEEGRRKFWRSEAGVHTFGRAIQGYHPKIVSSWCQPETYPDTRPVLFTGSYNPRRDEVLSIIQGSLGDRLKVHSQTGGWQSVKNILPPVFGKDLREAFSGASCVLDISDGRDVAGYHSDRLVDAMAAGVPTIAEWVPDLDQDFIDGVHLIYWRSPGDILSAIEKVTTDPGVGATLNSETEYRVQEQYGYRGTVIDVVRTCKYFKESVGRGLVPARSQPIKRKNVLIYGQWRPQGLGYIARYTVDVVNGCGGRASVASINKNPTWPGRHFEGETPSEDTEAIIFLEKAKDSWISWAKSKGVPMLYLPMWEFFRPEPEIRWAKEMDLVAGLPNEALEEACGREVVRLPWESGMFPSRPLWRDEVVFYHDARGIWQEQYDLRPRQHTDVVIETFRKFRQETGKDFKLILRTANNPLNLGESWIEEVTGPIRRPQLFELIRRCDVAICPTGPEGLGLPYWEYLALGVVPIALDVIPANRAITKDRDGLLVTAIDSGPKGLARSWTPDSKSLLDALMVASNPHTVWRMKDECWKTTWDRYGSFQDFIVQFLNR